MTISHAGVGNLISVAAMRDERVITAVRDERVITAVRGERVITAVRVLSLR